MTERQYKDSGIEWIGEIPKDWNVLRLKFCLSEPLKYGANESGVEYDSKLPRYIRITDISGDGSLKDEGKLSLTDEKATDFLLKDGDILFARSGATVGKSFIYRSKYGRSAFAGYLIKASVNNRLIADFLNYITLSYYYDAWKNQIFTQATIQNIGADKYNQLPVILPSKAEQQQIVEYLDSKTAAIDSAIQAQKDIVEKLKEYRQSVITEAVTKGLNPDAKMKNIDFLWVHEFPENWGIYKLNHLLDYNHPYPLGDGDHGSIKAKDYATCGIPLLRVQNLGYAESINTDNLVYISKAQNETIKNSTLYPDDILFAKTGSIGKTAILTSDTPIANTTSHIGKITVNKKKFFPRYVYYFLSSEIGIFQLWDIASKKATRPEVGLDEVKYIKFLIPNSIAEQKAISDYLDAQCNRIANAISHCNAIIEKLEEYKKSIIYNAVTGKIDCRKDVIPE